MKLFNIFGGNSNKIKEFKKRKAVLLDVRTKKEFETGAIYNSINIPLNDVNTRASEIKEWNKPVITYCSRGIRSATAKSILKKHGIEVINGGSLQSLKNKLQ